MNKVVLQLIHMTGPGGAETVLVELARELTARGWRVEVAIPEEGWISAPLRATGIEPHVFEMKQPINYVRSVMQLISRRKVSIVHNHLLGPAFYGGIAARLRGTPSICTFHGTSDIQAPHFRASVRYGVIRHTNGKVILVSEALREELVRNGYVSREMTEVIPNGVDLDLFQPSLERAFRSVLKIAPDEILVGVVGNIRPAKDYATLIRAAAIVKQQAPHIRFAICGDTRGPEYQALIELRDQLGVTQEVVFAGFHNAIHEILPSFDMLAVSSKTEGFSLATVQAMACELPVVATRCGGPEEIITDGVDGILVAINNPGELAREILRLSADKQLRMKLGREAGVTARTRFSVQSMVDAYENEYARLIRNDR